MTTWQHILDPDTQIPFDEGDKKGINGPFPKWWPSTNPPTCKTRNAGRLEMAYGFPYLSPWALEQNNFTQMPPINIAMFFLFPSDALLKTMPKLIEIGKEWQESKLSAWDPQKKWIDLFGKKMADFWDSDSNQSYGKMWLIYLTRNCPDQLAFFGLFKDTKDTNPYRYSVYLSSNWFQAPLKYSPVRWTFMVYFSLMIYIARAIKNHPATPFIDWTSTNLIEHIYMDEKTNFPFPIIQLIKNKDTPQILLLANTLRGSDKNIWSKVESFQDIKAIEAFQMFWIFYESGNMSKLQEQQILYIMNALFRILYKVFIQSIRSAPTKVTALNLPLNSIDPNGILNNPFANIKTTTDFMLWSLMIMMIDLKKNPPLFEKFKKLPRPDESRIVATWNRPLAGYSNEVEQFENLKRDLIKAVEWEWDRNHTVIQDADSLDAIGIRIKTWEITGIRDESFDNYLNLYRTTWRDTAVFRFLGIGEQEWPPKYLASWSSNLPSNSMAGKIYNFIQNNPPRRLKRPGLSLLEWKHRDSYWEVAFAKQFKDYLTWVVLNVTAREKTDLTPSPGTQFRDEKGEYIWVEKDGQRTQLLNSFPDYMMEEPDKGNFRLSKAVAILMIPADQAASWFFGSKWEDMLDNFGKKIWEKVKDALIYLVNKTIEVVKDVVKAIDDALPDMKYYLLLGVAGIVAFVGVETLFTEEIKKLAR